MILVLAEHDRGTLHPTTLEAVSFARSLAPAGSLITAAVLNAGERTAEIAATLGRFGIGQVLDVISPSLADYGPETAGTAVAELIQRFEPTAVVASGTDRGNETLAQAAARSGRAFMANVLSIDAPANAGDQWTALRVRWGGSLHEAATLTGPTKIVSVTPHAIEPTEAPTEALIEQVPVTIDPALERTNVVDRVERAAGVTLATAPVVVGGGRGVGSAEGFAPLEELASALGGVVGCSRAVTNNGWRNHADQVGQTGTRIAPVVYFAAGISGAIQHWVGAMASKTIIAINTDGEANMVTKADYAVIGDLHEVIPAITSEIAARRQGHG